MYVKVIEEVARFKCQNERFKIEVPTYKDTSILLYVNINPFHPLRLCQAQAWSNTRTGGRGGGGGLVRKYSPQRDI